MYRKNKKKLAITVIFFFISTIFYNLGPAVAAYAENLVTVGAYQVSLSAQNATEGGQAIINGKITIGNQNGNYNTPITIKVPNDLTNVSLNSSGLSGYFTETESNGVITLTPLPGTSNMQSATFSITGTLNKNVTSDTHNIPVTINGQSAPVPINVASPGGNSGSSSSSSGNSGSSDDGGYVPPPTVNGLNGVNLNQPIGKYFTPSTIGGKFTNSQTIPLLNGGNNTINYSVFVNSNLASGNTFTDDLPQGMSYVQNSLAITQIPSGNTIETDGYGPIQVSYNNNELQVSGFSALGAGTYKITYQCVVSLQYAAEHFDTTLSNVGHFAGNTSTAKLTINTEKSHFNPSLENGMITKTVNKPVFNEGTNSLNYTLTVNPKGVNISNAKIVDKLPAGITLQDIDTNPYSSNYGNVSVNVYKNGNYVSTPFNICDIDSSGNKSYPLGNFPSNQVLGTLYYNQQTNEISVDIPSTNDKIVINYSVNVAPNAKNIANTATISNDGVSTSSTAVSQYASTSTALGMWKTAYWINNNGQKIESSAIQDRKSTLNIDGAKNPDVTYVIHVENNGAYFPNGELQFNDPIAAGAKILKVTTPKGIGYTIKDNKIYFTNTGYIEPGSFDVEITCSLADFKAGSTIDNTAYIGNWGTDTVIVHKASNTVQEQPGSLTITKTNEAGTEKLQGAEFTVTGPNGFNKVVTTDKDGVANLSNLAWGTYTVKETKAPTGYVLDSKGQTLVIGKGQNGTVDINQKITVKDQAEQGSIKVVKTDAQTGNPVAGAVYTATNGTNSYQETTDAEGVAEFTGLPWGTYTVQETTAPQGYEKNSQAQKVTINAESFNSNGVFQEPVINVKDNEMTGNLTITKTGINGTKLAGAEFTVKGPNGFSKVVTTDKEGVANLSGLAWGTYTVQETKAPAGYNLNNEVQTVKINANDVQEVQKVDVKDAETTGTLVIEKTDITNEKEVAGAKIEITGTSDNGQKIDTTFTSGTTPTTFTLPAGTYTYKEVDAPVGYQINTTVGKFTISKQGQIVKADVKDARVLGQMSITKTGKDGVKLEGAQFTVTGPNGFNKVFTTGKDGVVDLSGLAWGTYTVKETKAPIGYNLNPQAQTVKIDAQDAQKVQPVVVSDTQILGQISITKTNASGDKKLKGAEFTVTGPNGFNKVVTTDKDGVATLQNLVYGTYKIQETKAPVGYNLNNEVQTVNITRDNASQVKNVVEKDTVTTGTLNIEKTDITNEKEVAGAKIQIMGTALDGQKVDITFTSGTTPTKFTLPAGTYTYKEVDAPVGYQINTTVGKFTISEQGQIVKADVKDARILGSMQIVKTGINDIKLKGAEFKVTGPNGFSKVVTTDKDGVANLSGLAWGTYTVQETKAPAGYNLNSEVQTVKVDANDAKEVQKVNVKDTETTGTLVIEKTDITNEKEVAGAKIAITGTSDNGQKVDITFTSGTTPTKFTLPAGTYTYKEVDAPVGYQINTTVGKFTISKQGQIVKADVKDARVLGQMSITKTGINGTKLQGAEFTVTGPNGFNKVVTTDKEGVANLSNLDWGTYKIQETKAPAGYNLNSEVQTVKVDANDAKEVQKVNVKDTETTGTLVIEKTDITNEKEVAGAKIQIQGTSDNGQKVDIKFTSGTTPTKFTLPAGTYTYTEVDAPTGYQINKTVGKFTISKQGQIVKADVKDARVLGQISITKTGKDGVKLEGAQFTVTGPNGFNKVVTTDKDGVANLKDLAWGTYKVQETKAPDGYNLNNEVQTVKIDANDTAKVQPVSVSDNQILGQISITKTNENGTKKLEGAQFTVTGPNGFNKVVTTDRNGVANLKDLAWGTYTVKETKAPIGYNLNNEVQTVEVTAASVGKVQSVSVKDNQILGNLTITKTNENGTEMLQGAEFKVTGPNGFSEVVTTGANGIASLSNLEWGTYYVKEIKAPQGYNINNTIYTVNINAQDALQVQAVKVKDSLVKHVSTVTNNTTNTNSNITSNSNSNTNNSNGLSPQTGDASQLPIYILLAVAIIGLVLNTRRKKKVAKK